MGTAENLFSLKNYYKIVVPYRVKTICRKFKTCFLKIAPNVRCSWGILSKLIKRTHTSILEV